MERNHLELPNRAPARGKHRLVTRRVIDTFQIAITYCEGTVFLHEHNGENHLEGALEEYTAMLKEAIEPTLTDPNARHIRMVTLVGYDEEGRLAHHIDSGLFPCEHMA